MTAFQALAESLHFARAASRVNLSPSALSRLVSRLEEELGVPLFERDTRRVGLTPAGERFLLFARESLSRRDELSADLETEAASGDILSGHLRLYASVTACYSILPPLVEALYRDHPALRLSVLTGDPAGAAQAVRENGADLAVSAIPENGFPDLEAWSVRKTPLVFAASAAGPWGGLDLPRDGEAAVDDTALVRVLAGLPLILPQSGLARQRYDRWVKDRSRGFRGMGAPEVVAETSGNEALLALARLGAGLALVPRLVLENTPFADGLVLYQAGPGFGDYDIGYVYRRRETGSQSHRARLTAVARLIRQVYP